MAEAAEVGHWGVLQAMNENAGNGELGELIEWALPIQQRHLSDVLDGAKTLAGEEDPSEAA